MSNSNFSKPVETKVRRCIDKLHKVRFKRSPQKEEKKDKKHRTQWFKFTGETTIEKGSGGCEGEIPGNSWEQHQPL